MNIENLEVNHKAFGKGVVSRVQGNYITVRFATAEKVFVYPDIFEKFLTLGDGTVSDEILADIDSAKKKKQERIDKKNEENIRAMTKGIVVPGSREILGSDLDEEEGRAKPTDNE